jgi:hypothetical protein
MILYHMFGPSLSAVQQRQGLIARNPQPNCSYDDVHLSILSAVGPMGRVIRAQRPHDRPCSRSTAIEWVLLS